MKKQILFLLSFICLTVLPQRIYGQDTPEKWIKENYTKKEFYIPMRDGVKLYTAVYIPNNATEKHPFLITRTPYSCQPYGEENFEQVWNNYTREYFKEGYIYVKQDVRGRYMSEGAFVDIRPFIPHKKKKEIDEASDSYDTVEWLLEHIPNNNGKVGFTGSSYNGFYAFLAAKSLHPAIKAVNPQAPATDWYMGDDFHHNGAFMLQDAFLFYTSFGKPHRGKTTSYPPTPVFFKNDAYSFFKQQKTIKNLTRLMGDSIHFWNLMLEHPDYDQFWQERDARRHSHHLQAAVLITGGFYDAEDCFGAFNLYQTIKDQNPELPLYLAAGPWDHGGWRADNRSSLGNIAYPENTNLMLQQEIEIPFFNYYLKGQGDITALSPATIYFTGSDRWKRYAQWPTSDVVYTPFYLQENGKITLEKPDNALSFSSYTSDPDHPVPFINEIKNHRPKEYMNEDQRFASFRPDVLTFQSDILTEDLTVAGKIIADLKVSISTTDADFVVKVIDVFPDDFRYDKKRYSASKSNYLMCGYQMLIRGEVMRGKYRRDFSTPQPFVPNEPDQVKFELPDIAHTFKKGHRLMIQIQSSWFPLVDRNPQQFTDIYHCDEADFVKSEIKIFHQTAQPSSILLPVLPASSGN